MTEEWPTPALYQQALDQVKGDPRNCDDAALMANLPEANTQNLLGAVSPVLVWPGAQAKGHDHPWSCPRPAATISLMWKEFKS